MSRTIEGLGMWVWEGAKDDPDRACSELARLGYEWVAVKAHDGRNLFNHSTLPSWAHAARRHHLRLGLWGYVYGQHPTEEAALAASLLHRYAALFYIADAETEVEHSSGPVSRIFAQAFRSHAPHAHAVLSSFGRIDLHGGIDWRAWRDHGFSFMPQAYSCETAALRPEHCVRAALAVWPHARLFPTLGAYRGAQGTLDGHTLAAEARRVHVPGFNVWDLQEATSEQIATLGRSLGNHAPIPKPKPRPTPSGRPPRPAPRRPAGVPPWVPHWAWDAWLHPWKGRWQRSGRFRRLLDDHGYLTPNFTIAEARCKDGTPIPRAWHKRARDHAFRLERMRHRLGDKPLPVISWYRTPAYNARIGGARLSKHMEAIATDFSTALVEARGRGRFLAHAQVVFKNGGVGIYPGGSVHLDSRGVRARWSSWTR